MELNKIYNMDCLDGFKFIQDESVDLIVTDPPYKVTSRGNSGNSGGMLQKEINRKGDVFEHNQISSKEYLPEFYRILKNGSHCYVMTNHVNLQEMLNNSTDVGFNFIKCLIWDKGNKIMGQYYMNQFEYILFLRKGFGKKINDCGTSDILKVYNDKTKNKNGDNLNDTEKPIDLMKVLILNSSKENELILDPFTGVGSTLIAAKQTKRNYIGFEIDNKYFEIAEKRLNEKEEQITLFEEAL